MYRYVKLIAFSSIAYSEVLNDGPINMSSALASIRING